MANRKRNDLGSRCALCAAVIAVTATATAPARAETVEVFAAGSLRCVVSDLANEVSAAFHIQVNASFGGSGSMRERIEKGEKADVLLSADLGSPHKLESEGRTFVPVIAFARNRLCVVSRKSAHINAANFIDRMLEPKIRVKTSTPIVDPSGDYAWALFDAIDRIRPASGAILKGKAESLTKAVATSAPTSQGAAALFSSDLIDVSITYCSDTDAMQKDLPELTSFEVPVQLDPHPVYGLAVLTSKPGAMQLALFLLSEKGQAILAKEKLIPILDSVR